ncbi:MAG: STAS domain-containing protein [Thermoleophilia bacterium]
MMVSSVLGMNVLIDTSTTDGAFIIHVDGELDVYTAPQLKDAIAEGISQGLRLVVVDLTRVGFLDSTALGVLVGGRRSAHEEGGDVVLVVDSPHLEKMFRITGFETMFGIHRTVDEALATV